MSERHLIGIVVPAYNLAQLLVANAHLLLNDRTPPEPFPDDTRYVRAYYDHGKDAFVMVFEHETFPRTCDGCEIMHGRVVVMLPATAGYLEAE